MHVRQIASLTAALWQIEAKNAGLPWSAAKGYDTFCAVGPFIPPTLLPDPHNVRLWLDVNGQRRQDGNTQDMIFKIPELIAHTSSIMRLEEGDLLLTGTPAGAGPVRPGDIVMAGLGDNNLSQITFKVVNRPAPARL